MIRQRQDQLQLFNLATAYDSDAHREIIDQRLESIRLLGMRYPRFDISQGSEQDRKVRTVEALLMMFQIDKTLSALTHGDVMPDDSKALDVLSKRQMRRAHA